MILRRYEPKDCEEMSKLFYDTVHTVNSKDYNEEQLNVWADGHVDLEKWNTSFLNHYSIVAVEETLIIGFGDIDASGYLDRLYIHKDYQNKGAASAICDELEHAVQVDKIVTHASITAKGFFGKRGYETIREQQVIKGGIALTNYIMEKQKEVSI